MEYGYDVARTVDGEKVTENRVIDIYEGLTCSGEPNEEEKELRRFLKLPLTKSLVHYKRADHGSWDIENVDRFEIKELYSDWFVLTLFIGNRKVNIHSAFLSEMQKPSFVEDMARQAAEDAEETA